nr:hypothetical protein [Tanacetum cinerariifolium]
QTEYQLADMFTKALPEDRFKYLVSRIEAEYVALSASYTQVMRMRTQLQDYGLHYNKIPLYYDSQSAITISCNPVQHSRTKHIYTRTEYQSVDMFTKALPEYRFKYLVRRIDVDHAGCIDTRKSTSGGIQFLSDNTSGGIQFLGDKLVSWMSKKQSCTAMSSAEAEYVALSASYAQVMWMRTQLQDYGFNYNKYVVLRLSVCHSNLMHTPYSTPIPSISILGITS